ncbi:metallo-beta-lactamase superfamily protein [Hyaloscypha finlandica]|nr:metallo-beta-lactamase superfamily protein [Hyaloscypha finlandica]
MSGLVEIGSLEATVIIDNEIDSLSTTQPNTVTNNGRLPNIAFSAPATVENRGGCMKELQMEDICCGAHGLSVLLTATKGDSKHTMMFDAGPEGEAWERNAKRLGVDVASIERIQLSHWHRDHSGGMERAIEMITEARGPGSEPVIVDLHPARPDYRGFMAGPNPISMQADPKFSEIEAAGGKIEKNADTHTVLDDMFLVSGMIPRVTSYEKGVSNGIRFENEKGLWVKDEEIADERFLMCNLKGKGIVMFTGCSHGAVVNASKNAIELLGRSVPLHAVVGGYHLVADQEVNVQNTVRDLQALKPNVLVPGHCSGWRVKYEIEKEMKGKLVPCTVGSRYIF